MALTESRKYELEFAFTDDLIQLEAYIADS